MYGPRIQFVVIVGESVYGLFATRREAEDWANGRVTEPDWRVEPLIPFPEYGMD